MPQYSRTSSSMSQASQGANLPRVALQPVTPYSDTRPPLAGNLYTGPDGIRHHRVRRLDDSYIGIGKTEREKTSQLDYITAAPKNTPFPRPRHERIGEIGWPVQFYNMSRGL